MGVITSTKGRKLFCFIGLWSIIIRVQYSTVQCVCVFFPFILDIKFVGRTSRGHTGGRSHRISHPPSFCGACLHFSREKDSAIPLQYSTVQYSVCVFSSHSFWTSSSLDVPAGVTQEEGHTGFLIHLLSAVRAFIFLARRIQPFLYSTVQYSTVCVCFLPIHSGHQVRWTYQPGSHRRKVTQDFSSTFFLRCVPSFFSREGFSHSFTVQYSTVQW